MKNELQIESLRQLLLAQKVQLIEKMKLERGGAGSRADAAVAQLSSLEESHAQNITARDTAFAMQERNVDELEAVELALNASHWVNTAAAASVTQRFQSHVCWRFLPPCAAFLAKLPKKK